MLGPTAPPLMPPPPPLVPRPAGIRRLVAVLTLATVPLLLVVAGCGSDGGPTGSADATGVTQSIGSDDGTAPATSGGPADTAGPGPSTTPSVTTGPATGPVPEADLPGEPFDLGYPAAGDTLGVVGVAHDDVLNVRSLPGASQPLVTTLAPLVGDVTTTGRLRQIPTEKSIWAEVSHGGVTGWVNGAYLAYLGGVDDRTSEVVAANGGQLPTAASLEALGTLVARMSENPDPVEGTKTVQTAPATVGDLGEITYDVVGMPDDAQLGVRLHVFATPLDGGRFALKSVEATTLCRRGVTGESCN